MAIRFTTGTLGAGKGMYWVEKMVQELRRTKRPIITNFALRVVPWVRANGKPETGLREYLLHKYGKDYDCDKRVHQITDEQVKEFFFWRVDTTGKLYKVEPLKDSSGVVGYDKASFDKSVPGTVWIDEAWQYFNARDFQKTDRMLLCYNAQNRKMGDDLWIATQHHSQVEKNLRVLAAEYHECVNHSKRRWGIFKQPGLITVIVSNDPPESRSRVTSYTRNLGLDFKGLGGCYDTCSGVGMAGAVGDIGEKITGLPFWVVILLIIGLMVGLAEVPNLAGKVMSHAASGFGNSVKAVPAPGVHAASGPSLGESSFGGLVHSRPSDAGLAVGRPAAIAEVVPVRMMTGFLHWRGVWSVLLDDGEIVSSEEPGRLSYLCASYAVIDGVTNRMRRVLATPVRGVDRAGARAGSYFPPAQVHAGASEGVVPW